MESVAEKSGADRGGSAHLRVAGGRVTAEEHIGSGTIETGLRTTRMKKVMCTRAFLMCDGCKERKKGASHESIRSIFLHKKDARVEYTEHLCFDC